MENMLGQVLMTTLSALIAYFGAIYKSKKELEKVREQSRVEIEKIMLQSENELKKLELEIEKQSKLNEQNAQLEFIRSAMDVTMKNPKMIDKITKLMDKELNKLPM